MPLLATPAPGWSVWPVGLTEVQSQWCWAAASGESQGGTGRYTGCSSSEIEAVFDVASRLDQLGGIINCVQCAK